MKITQVSGIRHKTLEDRGGWLSLEPEVRSALANRVEQELASRSIVAALAYFLVSIVVALTTSYYAEHPLILLFVSTITFVLGTVRMMAALRLQKYASDASPWTKRLFIWSIYGTFATWGTFCAWTLHLYAGQWTAMFLLLNTAALAGGTSSSLAPSLRLASRCLVLLIAPTIVSSLLLANSRHVGLAIVTTVYLGFLLGQAKGNCREFWNARVAGEREKIRNSAERRRAEAERATLVAAIEQAAEEILITDAEGKIKYCNPAFERMTGYLRDEVIGRNPRFLKSGKHDTEFYQSLWKNILSKGAWTGCFTNRKKDGSLYEVEGTISAIHDISGQLAGFVSARHDVTEQHHMEWQLRQAQKMESIGRLAGGIAHDFNNILTVIGGYSAALEDLEYVQDPVREYAREIRRSSERAAALTKQLLAFSRKQIAAPRTLDLNALITETQRMLQRLVGEDVEIEAILDPFLGPVRADADQMNQILMNLSANARDAMPNGGKLGLRTASVELPETSPSEGCFAGPAVLLSVSDTGVGMNEEIQQHIFEPFFTTKDVGQGTGLGLSMVYGIVRQSNGFIEVQSAPGRGTTFNIYLPRLQSPAPAERVVAPPATVSLRGSETVLLVEDQDDVRHLITTVLRSYGYNVLAASNGTLGVAQANRYVGPIDLLLTDVIMPGMTGKDMADYLLSLRPGLRVLYISGYSGDVIAHRGVLDEDVAYLPKPFTPELLAAKVREVLGKDLSQTPSQPD